MASWNEIVREHGPAVYQAAWRILGHVQDCEDVMQEVFIEAHKKFLDKEVAHWRTFLHRMTTYRALDALRRRRQADPLVGSEVDRKCPGPDRETVASEEVSRVRDLIATLPPRQAAVFSLSHLEDMSHDDIATTLEISVGAVAMALHKARSNLRATLTQWMQEDNS